MSFYEQLTKWLEFDFARFFATIGEPDVLRSLAKERLDVWDFLTLLSPAAEKHLEPMAQRAHRLTVQHFGRVILLYTPLYLADYCVNQCAYCGFSVNHAFRRSKLSLEEVEREAQAISSTELKHLLILTGESRKHSDVSYIRDCVQVLRRYFSSVAIEIYPLETEEYRELVAAGVDGLTIYQEVYDPAIYDRLHIRGPKKNYLNRLDAPERGCQAGMRGVNIGALLGLGPFRSEAFFTGLHAHYLQDKYLDVEVSVSVPRIRPLEGGFPVEHVVSDRQLVQMMTALRLFLPRAGLTLSTRESAKLRDHLMFLGVTRMSAGSSMKVGGHEVTEKTSVSQFDISDERSVQEMRDVLLARGYQPIFKDWHVI